MAYKFPSPAWVEQFVKEIERSSTYAEVAKNWEGDVLLVIDGGDAVYLDLWHGECRAAEYLADDKSKRAEFRISASMEKWRLILEGKLDAVQGLMTRQVRLEGNLVKVMKNIKAAQEMVRCATRVETEF
jgi:putative sterol carrier protein